MYSDLEILKYSLPSNIEGRCGTEERRRRLGTQIPSRSPEVTWMQLHHLENVLLGVQKL